MKKIILIIFLMNIIPVYLFSSVVTLNEAQSAAETQLQIKNKVKDFTINQIKELINDNNQILAYIINLEPIGFIALSTDTNIKPIIAYSFNSNFIKDNNENNILYHMLKDDMQYRLEATNFIHSDEKEINRNQWNQLLSRNVSYFQNRDFQQWPPEGSTSTGGWVETTWNQHPPYNNFCPLDPDFPDFRCVVGCTATSMAQIINYHQYCGNIQFGDSDEYVTSNGINIDADSTLYDFPSFEQMNTYLSILHGKYQNQTVLDTMDLAVLSFACGISALMDYSANSSGAYTSDAKDALLNKFSFYSADLMNRSDTFFYDILQFNMMEEKPAILEIIGPGQAHSIICDGYNSNNEYHLNFGWGSVNPDDITMAWYCLPDSMPAGYNVVDKSIVNIKDEPDQVIVYPRLFDFLSVVNDSADSQTIYLENTSDQYVQIDSLFSPNGFLLSYNSNSYLSLIEPFDIPPYTIDSIFVKFCPADSGFYEERCIVACGNESKNIKFNGYAFNSGTIINSGYVSGIWNTENSPYYISGDIVVQNNDLTILPGVEVFFPGKYTFVIKENGQLIANGEEDNLIIMKSLNTIEGWFGLSFHYSSNDDTLSYCEISNTKRDNSYNTYEGFGGAIFCRSSSPTITNNILINNYSQGGGAGIHCSGSSAFISGNVIANNESHGAGCGIYINNCSNPPLIFNNIIVNNTSHCGSGGAGGIYAGINGSKINIFNNVIANNYSPGMASAIYSESPINAYNNIIWGNSGSANQLNLNNSESEVIYCNIQDGFTGAGNINQDPLFVNPSVGSGMSFNGWEGEWHLMTGSPCLGSGIFNTDMGAYGAIPPSINVLDDTLIFGSYPQWNGNSIEKEIEIFNCSTNNNLIVENIAGQSGLYNPVEDFPMTIEPGCTESFTISLSLDTIGSFVDTLSIISNTTLGEQYFVCVSTVFSNQGTIIEGGTISGLLDYSNAPYYVMDDISVSAGNELIIEPGCELNFLNSSQIIIYGSLQAVGNSTNHIIFHSSDFSKWRGIKFSNSYYTVSKLEYCTIMESNGSLDAYGHARGGGINSENSSIEVSNCIFTNNQALDGGGVYICGYNYGYANISNNIFYSNFADYDGGAICILGLNTVNITNNTIIENESLRRGGAISIQLCDSISIVNNIIFNNTASNGPQISNTYIGDPQDLILINNNIEGGLNDIYRGIGNGVYLECIEMDPIFSDSLYHLSSISPCINAGTPDTTGLNLPIYDLDGNPRIVGNRIDMGTYEYNPLAEFTTIDTIGEIPFEVKFNDCSSPTDSLISWVWNFGDGSDLTYTTFIDTISHVYENSGEYTVSLTVTAEDSSMNTEIKDSLITVTETFPILSVTPDSLDFSTAIDTLYLFIENIGGSNLYWDIQESIPWLSVLPNYNTSVDAPSNKSNYSDLRTHNKSHYVTETSRSLVDTVQVIVNRAALNPGCYSDSLFITSNGGNKYVKVELEKHQSLWHISTTGNDSLGTGSFDNPFASIQKGINKSSDSDTVLVLPGLYFENINFMGKNITVSSLYLTIKDTTYIHQTIIDGNQNGSVVSFNNGEDRTAVLCGFTIRNGYAESGGGIYCDNNSRPKLENLIIQNNYSHGSGLLVGGGGIACVWNSSPYCNNIVLRHNVAYNGGGVFCDYGSSPLLKNTIVVNNYATNNGGAIFLQDLCNPRLYNLTISGNSSQNNGGAIYCDYGNDPVVINSIISSNLGNFGIYVDHPSSNPNITYTNIWNNENGNFYNCSSNYPCIEVDPLFSDSLYHLTSTSPCINAGTPDTTGLFLSDSDLDGNPRIIDGRIDMGCYEYVNPSYVPQETDVISGWNMISFNNEPYDMDMQSIMNPLISNNTLVKVQDEAGGALVYLPGYGWNNTIGDMSNTEGYYINVTDMTNVYTLGNPAALPIDIPLLSGWNMMGYPCQSSQDAQTLLQPLIDDSTLVKIQDEAGGTIVYLPGYGWHNTIGDLEPGEGYYINVNEDDTVTITEPVLFAKTRNKITNNRKSKIARSSYFKTAYTTQGYNHMNVFVATENLHPGDEIGIYDRNVCVGSGVITDDEIVNIVCSADDPLTKEVDGFIQGDQISYRLWGVKEKKETKNPNIEVEYILGDGSFYKLGTAYATLKDVSQEIPDHNYVLLNYPNPFKHTTTIDFGLKESSQVKMSIYNIKGQEVKTLVNNNLQASRYEIVWDGKNDNHRKVGSGVYFYKIEIKNDSKQTYRKVNKLLLIK